MSDKPPRRFWQIHLSTAVIVMLVAGALLGLNFTRHISDNELIRDAVFHGWPFPVVTYAEWFSPERAPALRREDPARMRIELNRPKWHARGIAMNSLISIGLLIVSASISEFSVRRRERGRT